MLERMRQSFMRFMIGRYGMDQLSKFLFGFGMVMLLLSMIFRNNWLYILAVVTVVYGYYRVFSKNHRKRYAENNWFYKHTYKITNFFKKQKNYAMQRKTHHIYTCAKCRQKIRIPKGKGRIMVRCPKCNYEFIKNS